MQENYSLVYGIIFLRLSFRPQFALDVQCSETATDTVWLCLYGQTTA